ncbi:MAG: DEAD/DEAH box helicase [Candidatus Zhuqueibacterota bacterium]
MDSFKKLGLTKNLIKGIKELGFEDPMPIQAEVIPTLLTQQRDLIGLAQTGTGKTAAFGLPILQTINPEIKKTQAVILAPTRELSLQITSDLKEYAKYLDEINIVTVYGGADMERQIRALKKGAHIIVATPGRMNDLLNRQKQIDLSEVRTVVLDEADEMLSMGFKEELDAIFEQMPETKITLFFSATMPDEVSRLSKKYLRQPLEISAGRTNTGADNVEHLCYSVHEKNRYLALKRIVDFNPDIYGIIFCRTREETRQVAEKLIQDGYNVDVLHGDLSQAQREAVMHKFRNKNLHLLTATDVAARGIDVKDLTHIINYNLPDEIISYIHRSGRTGRAGSTGISVALVNLKEKHKIKQIETRLKKKFTHLDVPGGKEICEKQLLHLVDRLQKNELDSREIEDFLPAVYEKLAGLDKQELIKQFVSLEFNRYLNYYRDAKDLAAPTESEDSKIKSGKKKSVARSGKTNNRHQQSFAEEGFTRFFINLGFKDSLTPPDLIGLVNRSTRQRDITIGKIDIMRNFSFFEVDEYFADTVLTGFKNIAFNKRKAVVEITQRPVGKEFYAPGRINKKLRRKSRQRV